MRSFKRAAVVSAMALPLALGSAGVASADAPKGHKDHEGEKCVHKSCQIDVEKHKKSEKNNNWVWNWLNYSPKHDTSIINAGIIG